MTNYTFANLDQWVTKTEKRMDVVVKQATSDLIGGIEIVPGITRGGTRQKGKIPRDLGFLAASLQSSLYGGTAISGANSYVMVAGAMKAGDVATFSWSAPYSREVHYGARGVPGTFWVQEASAKWQSYVDAATARAKAQVA